VGKFLLVIVVFAALVYTVFWLIERRRGGKPPARRTPRSPGSRTVAPDDDEDFLRDLNRRFRRPDQGHPND
jgi:hypothetical protein